MKTKGGRLTRMLRIRTDEETIKKFKKFMVENDCRRYHDALKKLLDNCAARRRLRDDELRFL